MNLPSYTPTISAREMLAELDTKGLLSIIAAVVLILVATSQGVKSETPWNSPTIIGLYVFGSICMMAFLIIEWRWAKTPIIPLKLLGNRSIAAMLVQTFLLGATYHFSNYYLQLYLQNVHDYSPFKSALLQMSCKSSKTTCFSMLCSFTYSTVSADRAISLSTYRRSSTNQMGQSGLLLINQARKQGPVENGCRRRQWHVASIAPALG